MQENVVIHKSTILKYCMVSISILITFSSAEELLEMIEICTRDCLYNLFNKYYANNTL